MKKSRQLHLWIGLITSILILIESITGLILSEPWLIGASSRGGHEMVMSAPAAQPANGEQSATQNATASDKQVADGTTNAAPDATATAVQAQRPKGEGFGEGGSSLMGIIRGLHEGKIGGTNLKILADITAIGMITLTVTGITLSLRVLKSQRMRKKKNGAVGHTEE